MEKLTEHEKTRKANEEARKKREAKKQWWTTQDAMTVSTVLLIFGFLAMVLVGQLLMRDRRADDVLKTLGVILIIFATLFLVVAGYNDQQIAPVIGLYGTIAGYLLGRAASGSDRTSGERQHHP